MDTAVVCAMQNLADRPAIAGWWAASVLTGFVGKARRG